MTEVKASMIGTLANEFSPSPIEQRFTELCLKVVQECGLKIYDLEYNPHSSLLRLFIWDENTKTAQLNDCVKVDQALTPYLEQAEWVPESLTLEVSSPGVYRTLKSLEHFKSAEGEDIALVLRHKLTALEEDANCPRAIKANKKLRAKLIKVSDEGIELLAQDYTFNVKYSDIKKANLDPAL